MKNYFSLVKISHTIFALPFALIGFYLGLQETNFETFPFQKLVFILICMVSARTAAMSFNRYIDREIDAKNFRTASREIPAGVIAPQSALWLTIISSIIFIISSWFINSTCFYLSFIAIAIVLGYSYTKRFTWLCHFVLGLGLSLAPIGAYLAVTNHFAIEPIIYSLIVLFWVGGFDIIYALQDKDFDMSQNLKSIPVRLGINKALTLSNIIHGIAIAFVLASLIISEHCGVWQYLGAIIFISLLIYQHLIISAQNLSRINVSFFTLNGMASIIFATLFIINFYLN